MISRKQFLDTKVDLKTEPVQVPEFGGEVIVKEMTAQERDDFETLLLKRDKDGKRSNGRAKLLYFTLVDEQGDRLFEEEDIVKIGAMPSNVINRIADVASRINGMSAEAVDVAAKN